MAQNEIEVWSTISNVLTGDRVPTRQQPSSDGGYAGTHSPAPNSGGYEGMAGTLHNERPVMLDVEEPPLRPIRGSIYYAHQLQEIREWSPEASDAIDLLSRDCFTSDDGEIDSWQIAGLKDGPDGERAKLDPNLESIARDLRQRRYGKDYVVGGDRLRLGVEQSLALGDSYLQLTLDREGMSGKRTDWCISESMYLPPLSMFTVPDHVGRESAYRQHYQGSTEFTDYHILKVLHFSYKKRGLYGSSLYLSRISQWERLKRLASKVEDALSSCGVAPWIHTLPKETPATDVEKYKKKLGQLEDRGIIKSLVLLEGSDVKKAANNDAGLKEILEYWLELRQSFIPLGMPDYFFSSLPNSVKSNRDLGLQPAALYARTRASNQAIAGEQAKWALDIEIVMKMGYEFWKRNPYDIVWPKWDISPTQHIEVGRDRAPAVSAKEEALTKQLESAIGRYRV